MRLAPRIGTALALLILPLLLAGPAHAAPTDEWQIRSFTADITVQPDGTLHVTETIEVTFHSPSRGIYREIPFRYPVDDSTVRRLRFDHVRVRTSEGTPSDMHEERSGDYQVWRIGDEHLFIRGDHVYEISYRVRGALNRFDSHDELFWNVTGDRWEVPIEQATATVRAPQISHVTCFAGPTGGTNPCASADHDGTTATFTADELAPGTQLDVVVAIPLGHVDVPPPELEAANPIVRAFTVDLPRALGAGAISAAGLAAAMFLFHRGRDRPAAPGRQTLPGGVEYRPPDGLRPAQLRALLTERVNKASLSATLVDLAVRGYVRIEEVEERRRKQDWLIRRQPDRSAKGLLKFEKEVLKGLFKGGRRQVRVSELGRGAFYQHYQAVTNLLYTDLVRRRFYARSPRTVRRVATAVALVVLSAGVSGMVLVFAADLNLGLLVAPLPIIGLLLLIGARHAPRRTPTGTAMYRRAAGFREFIRTAEADRMAFAEREQIFADYLPYAMAFDCVERWVKVFAQLGVSPQTAAGDWYVGRTTFDAGGFSSAMSSLGSQVGGSMSQNIASSGSSSGFSSGSSGGGFGGGGGGRW